MATVKHQLYGGSVEVVFDESRHLYTAGGTKLHGVTSILGVIAKPMLVPWAAKETANFVHDALHRMLEARENLSSDKIVLLCEQAKGAHRKKKDQAADIGSIVHAAAEHYIATGEWGEFESEKVNNSIAALKQWFSEHHVEFLRTESVVYSRTHGYAGMFDGLAMVDGVKTLIDFKTSTGCYPEMGLQLALTEETPDIGIEKRVIVRIGKDGELETREYPNYEDDCKAFLAALDIYRWQKKYSA
jgi:hypothetical protein